MNSPTDHDHDPDFSRRLRARFDVELADLPAGSGPEAAVARAHSRRRNRRTVLASVAAVAVIAGASTQALGDDPGEADLATASQNAVVDDALTFDWTTTEGGLSHAQELSAGDSGLYALSTAPGTRYEDHPDGAPRAMYRLADDGSWTPIELEGDDPNVATVSEREGTLYTLSTGAATSEAAARPQASVSTDGGENWSSVPLQEANPPSDEIAWRLSYNLDLASTTENTVALVSARIDVPYEDLFPELFEDEANGYTTETTADGIALLRYAEGRAIDESGAPMRADGPAPTTAAAGDENPSEIVRTVPWADLGISGPEDLAPQRWAYVADGDGWTEVPTPVVTKSSDQAATELHAVDGGFVLAVTTYTTDGAESTAYRSVDGRDWTPVEPPEPGEMLPAGDALLHIGHDPGQIVVQVSHDSGITWNPLDLASLDPSLADLSDEAYVWARSGPLGVAVLVGEPGVDDSTKMLFSTDLQRWSVSELGTIVPGANLGDVLVGTDRVVVFGHTDRGQPGSPERTATVVGVPRRA